MFLLSNVPCYDIDGQASSGWTFFLSSKICKGESSFISWTADLHISKGIVWEEGVKIGPYISPVVPFGQQEQTKVGGARGVEPVQASRLGQAVIWVGDSLALPIAAIVAHN